MANPDGCDKANIEEGEESSENGEGGGSVNTLLRGKKPSPKSAPMTPVLDFAEVSIATMTTKSE